MYRYLSIALILVQFVGISHIQGNETSLDLSLETIFHNVELNNYNLKAKKEAINTALSKQKQATVLPNPELEIESENIFGEGEASGFDAAETTVLFTNSFERPKKRKARKNLAKSDTSYAKIDFELSKQSLFLTAFDRYITALSKKEHLSIAKKQQQLHKSFVYTIKKQVESGRLAKAELTRSEIELELSYADLKRADYEFEESVSWLSALWNEPAKTGLFQLPALVLPIQLTEKYPSTLEDRLESNLAYQLIGAQLQQSKKAVELEKTVSKIDPVISAGVKQDSSTDESSFVAGIGLPIPLFDRNKSNINAAEFQSKEMHFQLKEQQTNLSVHYQNTIQLLALLEEEIISLKDSILPKTESVYSQVQKGYLQGKYAYLDVINAQQHWSDTQKHYVSVLQNYWMTLAEAELLLGHSLDKRLPKLFQTVKGDSHD